MSTWRQKLDSEPEWTILIESLVKLGWVLNNEDFHRLQQQQQQTTRNFTQISEKGTNTKLTKKSAPYSFAEV